MRRHAFHRQVEQVAHELLHLRDGVGAQNINGHAARLGVHHRRLAVAIIRAQGHERVGFVRVAHDDGRHAESFGGLLQPVARHAVRIDADRPYGDGAGRRRGRVGGARGGSRRVGDRRQPALGRIERRTPRRRSWRSSRAARRDFRRLLRVQLGPHSGRGLLDLDLPVIVARADLGRQGEAAQERVDRGQDIGVDRETVTRLDLDQHVEGGRGAPFEHRLLGTAPARFLVRESDRFDAADQVAQGRVEQQVVERDAVRGADELDAALGDGARRLGFEFAADLVNDDDFGVVILDRLDHDLVLERRHFDLHAARLANRGMRHVAVAADLVGGVHDDDALGFGQDARGLAQEGGLAHTGAAENEQGLARVDDVLDDVYRPVDGAPDAAGEADDDAAAVADGGDAMKRALHAGAVVRVEIADALGDVVEVGAGHFFRVEHDLFLHEARGGHASEVEDDFEQVFFLVGGLNRMADRRGKHVQHGVEVVGNAFLLGHRVRVSGSTFQVPRSKFHVEECQLALR